MTQASAEALAQVLVQAEQNGWDAQRTRTEVENTARQYNYYWQGADTSIAITDGVAFLNAGIYADPVNLDASVRLGVSGGIPLTRDGIRAAGDPNQQAGGVSRELYVGVNLVGGALLDLRLRHELELGAGSGNIKIRSDVDLFDGTVMFNITGTGRLPFLLRRIPLNGVASVTTSFIDIGTIVSNYSSLFPASYSNTRIRNEVISVLDNNVGRIGVPGENILFAAAVAQLRDTGNNIVSFTAENGDIGAALGFLPVDNHTYTVQVINEENGYYLVTGRVEGRFAIIDGSSIQRYEAVIDRNGNIIEGFAVQTDSLGILSPQERGFYYTDNWTGGLGSHLDARYAGTGYRSSSFIRQNWEARQRADLRDLIVRLASGELPNGERPPQIFDLPDVPGGIPILDQDQGLIDPFSFIQISGFASQNVGRFHAWSAAINIVANSRDWSVITIAFDNATDGFGLHVDYNNGTSQRLATLQPQGLSDAQLAEYSAFTTTYYNRPEGPRIELRGSDDTVLSTADISLNADGSINSGEINRFIENGLFSESAGLFGKDGRIEIGRPEINIQPDFDDLTNEQQLASLNGQVGGILASSAGRLLTDQIGGVGGAASGIVVSELLSDAGAAFGAALNESGNLLENFSSNLDTALESFGLDVASASIGAVSSLLTAEVADALGLDGLAAEVFGLNYNSVVSAAVARGVEPFLSLISQDLASALVDATNLSNINPANLIGGFIGAKLGSLIVSPTTQAGAILSSVGSAVGGLIGGVKIGSSIGSFVLPGIGAAIGAFVGFVLGGLIGNLFGKKKPKIPTADASTVLNFQDGYYQLGVVHSANNGNEDLVTDMALSAAQTLNAFIDVVKGDDENARNVNSVSPTQVYGHAGNDLYVRVGGVKHSVDTANEAVEIGALAAIRETKIAGGDLFLKRAVTTSQSEDLATFGGDLQIAEDYANYIRNQNVINELITVSDGNEISTQAAGWIITLQRAAELGLNRSAESDFYGGAQGFVDSLKGVVSTPLDYEDVAFFMRGYDLEVWRDDDGNGTANSSGDTLIFDETGFTRSTATTHAGGGVGYNRATANSNLTIGNDIITNAAGTIDDLTTQTTSVWVPPEYIPEFDITIPGYWQETTGTFEGGDDIIIGNNGANTFRGRSGNDWLDGGAVRDVLYGGNDNDVLLGRGGNDTLYGENGDDVLVGGTGNDALRGGNGNDILIQGAGTGTTYGQAGDDTLIATQGTGYGGHHRGGTSTEDGGNDTFSFERYSEGITLNMAYRPGSWDTHSNAFYRHEDVRFYDIRRNDGSNTRINFFYVAQIDNVTGTNFGDKLTGDEANNTLRGLGGDDILNGGGGDDVIEGGAGADRIERGRKADGTWGRTTVSYEHSQGGVDVSIQFYNPNHANAAILGSQHAFGGDASGDTFVGYIHHLTGSAYADVLEGNHGSNVLRGLDGDDYFIVTRGSDQFHGGEGFDTVDYGNHTGAGLTIDVRSGTSRTYGYLNGVHSASGYTRSFDIEHIVGTDGHDSILTGDGDNVLEGGKGNDKLFGGAGNDIYFVELGGGHDTIYEPNTRDLSDVGGVFGNLIRQSIANSTDPGGHDTIMVGYEEGLSWDDVFIGAGEDLTVRVNGQLLATAYNSPSEHRELGWC